MIESQCFSTYPLANEQRIKPSTILMYILRVQKCIDGWKDVCMYVCMDGWMFGCLDVCMYVCTVGMYVCMYGWMDGWMDDVCVCMCIHDLFCQNRATNSPCVPSEIITAYKNMISPRVARLVPEQIPTLCFFQPFHFSVPCDDICHGAGAKRCASARSVSARPTACSAPSRPRTTRRAPGTNLRWYRMVPAGGMFGILLTWWL